MTINLRLGNKDGLVSHNANHLLHFMNETGNHCFQVKSRVIYAAGEVLNIQILRNQTKTVHWTGVYVNPANERFFEADSLMDG